MKNDLPARVRTEGHPLIDGNTVTFLWQGSSAPHLVDDLHDWEEHPQKMRRVSPGPFDTAQNTLWAVSFDLARDAYLEYAFYDPKTKTRFRDPLNPKRIWNGLGNYNHYFYMPDARPSPLTVSQQSLLHGRVTVQTVETWMMAQPGQRRVYLYHPPVNQRVPLLIVYDGSDYLRRGRLSVIVDNLIAQKRICPIAMAFLPNGGRRRGVEYACSDATLAWIEHDVLPLASRELKLVDIEKHPGAFGVLGASFGGLMSVYTGLRLAETFGRVISQSPVFETEGRDFVAVELIRHAPARPRIYMDCGTMDFLLEDNRRMLPILRASGFEITYHEYGGAHNYTSWRDHVHLGLEKMFG